jgi:hypothetical protein
MSRSDYGPLVPCTQSEGSPCLTPSLLCSRKRRVDDVRVIIQLADFRRSCVVNGAVTKPAKSHKHTQTTVRMQTRGVVEYGISCSVRIHNKLEYHHHMMISL